MIDGVSEHMLKELSRLLSIHTGLYFPEKKWPALVRGITSAASWLRKDVSSLIHALKAPKPPKAIIDLLADRLTIGETYFLRDKNFFQILQDQIIRGLLRHPRRKQKKIIFWSAGCATGEEPYSLAILIDHMLPEVSGWDISIIGTDISPRAIEMAKKGVYSRWSLRETPEPVIKRYFTQAEDNRFELAPHIRRMVSFTQMNLMDAAYPLFPAGPDLMDVIVCRNVLMYFNEENRNRVIHRLTSLLVENGWLITGPSEAGFVDAPELTPVRFPNALYHRKGPPRRSDDQLPSALVVKKSNAVTAGNMMFRKKRLTDRSQARRATDAQASARLEKPNYDIYQTALKDYHQGRYEQSVEKLLSMLSENPNGGPSFLMHAESLILLARSYANLGEIESARTWCEKAIGLEKLNPELYYLLATIHQSADDINAANKSLKQAIYLDPGFIMAHFTLGLLLQQKKMVFESAKSLNTALSLLQSTDPDDIVAYSEGITASRLIETIKSMAARG